jgi:acyl-CoA synthetase (AMP-forming)/AMP-acid ligase II
LARGPWVTKSYHREGKLNVNHDGWFTTGDVASIDPDGYLHITGTLRRFILGQVECSMIAIIDRKKDMIKSGGEWISSIDLENEAAAHPSVLEVAVIAIPHPKWEERPLLIVCKPSSPLPLPILYHCIPSIDTTD